MHREHTRRLALPCKQLLLVVEDVDVQRTLCVAVFHHLRTVHARAAPAPVASIRHADGTVVNALFHAGIGQHSHVGCRGVACHSVALFLQLVLNGNDHALARDFFLRQNVVWNTRITRNHIRLQLGEVDVGIDISLHRPRRT